MYDLGEKSTKYFLNLEKPRAVLSVMYSVIINQDEIRGKVEIYKPIFSFCQSLFSHKVQIQTDETGLFKKYTFTKNAERNYFERQRECKTFIYF